MSSSTKYFKVRNNNYQVLPHVYTKDK